MAGVAYIDSSALLKLVAREQDTSALEADLAQREGLITSTLAALECRRAARRASKSKVLYTVEQVLEAVYLIELTPAILDDAAAFEPPILRSLDAIHLATALSIDDPDLELITYDLRMADAARSYGLRVARPQYRRKQEAGSSFLVRVLQPPELQP